VADLDPRVSKISFTGAPRREQIIRKAGLKKVTMSWGTTPARSSSRTPTFRRVPRCVMSSFANSGQVCISLQRLYVHKAIAKEFTKRFVAETAS